MGRCPEEHTEPRTGCGSHSEHSLTWFGSCLWTAPFTVSPAAEAHLREVLRYVVVKTVPETASSGPGLCPGKVLDDLLGLARAPSAVPEDTRMKEYAIRFYSPEPVADSPAPAGWRAWSCSVQTQDAGEHARTAPGVSPGATEGEAPVRASHRPPCLSSTITTVSKPPNTTAPGDTGS